MSPFYKLGKEHALRDLAVGTMSLNLPRKQLEYYAQSCFWQTVKTGQVVAKPIPKPLLYAASDYCRAYCAMVNKCRKVRQLLAPLL